MLKPLLEKLIITLAVRVSPSADTPITIFNAGDENLLITLQANNEGDNGETIESQIFVHDLKKGVHVQVYDPSTLKLAKVDGNVDIAPTDPAGKIIATDLTEAEIPTAGSFEIPDNMTLQILGDTFTINTDNIADGTFGTVMFDEDVISIKGYGMVVEGAPAGRHIEIGGFGAYTINSDIFYAINRADIVSVDSATSKLFSGAVEIVIGEDLTTNTSVALSVGEVVSVNQKTGTAAEDAINDFNAVWVGASEGKVTEIVGIHNGESFNISNETESSTYTMYGLGLVSSENDGDVLVDLLQKSSTGLTSSISDTTIYTDYTYTVEGAVWSTAKLLDADNYIDLTATDVTKANLFVNSEITAIVATLTYNATETSYTLTAGEGLAESGVTVALNADSILQTDFDAVVNAGGDATINGVAFDSYSDTALVIAATANTGATLTEGTVLVQVSDTLVTTDKLKLTVAGDNDGVIVEASGGTITSITGLNADGSTNGVVKYNDVTYSMDGNGRLVVTGTDTTIYDGQDTATNLLDLANATAIVYRAMGTDSNTITFEADLKNVIYGTTENYEAPYAVANLNVDESGTYVLTVDTNADSSTFLDTINVNASSAPALTMTSTFAVEVTTAGDATINGTSFDSTSDTSLVIKAAGSSVTLTYGTVTVTDTKLTATLTDNSDTGKSVAFSGPAAEASDTNGVTVTVDNGVIKEIRNLNEGESVTYDGYTYTRDGNQIVKNNAAGKTVAIYNFDKDTSDTAVVSGRASNANVIAAQDQDGFIMGGYVNLADSSSNYTMDLASDFSLTDSGDVQHGLLRRRRTLFFSRCLHRIDERRCS